MGGGEGGQCEIWPWRWAITFREAATHCATLPLSITLPYMATDSSVSVTPTRKKAEGHCGNAAKRGGGGA